MAQTSWPFHDGTDGTPVLEDQWSVMARQWATSGVIDHGGDLAVYSDTTGREVRVAVGRATVRGHWYESDSIEILPIAANTSGNPRIDRVVLRLDPSADEIVLAVLEGAPAASPTAPTLTQTDTGIYELPLANVAVANGVVIITPAMITDTRVWASISVIPCTSTSRPASPTYGQPIIEIDTARLRWWDGSSWVGGFVPLSGGTMTGQLRLPALWIDGGDIRHGSRFSESFWDEHWNIIRMSPDGTVITDIPLRIDASNGLVKNLSDRAGVATLTSGAGGVITLSLPSPPAGCSWSLIAQSMTGGWTIEPVNPDGPINTSKQFYVTNLAGLAFSGVTVKVHWHAQAVAN